MSVDPRELKRKTLSPVEEQHLFHVCRGDKINNVQDLTNCIASLSQEEFEHHVNIGEERNDFAVWIHEVLENPLLAHDLNYPANLEDQEHFVKTLRDHISWLENI